MYKRYSPPKNSGNGSMNSRQNAMQNNPHVNYSQRYVSHINRNTNTSRNTSANMPAKERAVEENKKVTMPVLDNHTRIEDTEPHIQNKYECEKCRVAEKNISHCEKVDSCNKKPTHQRNQGLQSGTTESCCTHNKTENNLRGIINLVLGILPKSVYDSKSKKFFGIIGSEDLLLIMLIFLLMENEDEGENLLVYALFYLLVSDYIDIPLL